MKIRTMVIDDYDKVYELWTNTTGMGMLGIGAGASWAMPGPFIWRKHRYGGQAL